MNKILGLGIGATLLLALLYLFTLNQVSDTNVGSAATLIDEVLARNLDASTPTRVTMSRDRKGVKPPRTYVIRLHPDTATAKDRATLAAVCEKARDLVFTVIETVESEVTVHCVATAASGEGAHFAWRRVGGDLGFRIDALDPPPELPLAVAPEEP